MKGWNAALGILIGSNRSWIPRIARALILLTVLPVSPTPAASQADGEPITLGHYRVLHSAILGEDRTLQLHLPRGYETGESSLSRSGGLLPDPSGPREVLRGEP